MQYHIDGDKFFTRPFATVRVGWVNGRVHLYHRLYKFIVRFLVDGDEYNVQLVDSGKAAKTPSKNPIPPKGYSFSGWDVKFDKITADLDVNTVWKKSNGNNQ